jgi:flagellar basal-body rod protein FlgB
MSDLILDSTIGALNTSLNLRTINQNVIGSNIANADTPGYKAKEVNFEGAFRAALDRGGDLKALADESGHQTITSTDPVNPEIYEVPNDVYGLDGNTVDRSIEMAKMTENQILFDAGVEMMKKKLALQKYSITEGGGNR